MSDIKVEDTPSGVEPKEEVAIPHEKVVVDNQPEGDSVVDAGKLENVVDPVSEQAKFDATKIKDYIPYPSSPYSVLVEALEKINKMSKAQFDGSFTKQDTEALKTNLDSSNYANTDDMLKSDFEQGGYSNDVTYGGKDLSVRPLPINSKGVALNGDAAIARIASILGIGEVTQVPLWHSGFWITLRPIKDVELINLEIQLSNNQISLGRDTNTLIFSNYSVVFNRIVTNFIVNHIQNTTLDLPAGSDIRDYIATQDLPTMVNAILYSMHPKGYTLSRTCSNSVILDEKTNAPKCNYIMSGKIDFRKLLWVNRKMLTKEHLNIMSSRNPNSVTVDDVTEYRNTLTVNKVKTYDIVTSNGAVIKVELKTPMLSEYIDNGEAWINTVISKCESLFTDTTTDDERDNIIDSTTSAMILGIYNVYFNKIILEDGSVIENRNDIDEVLNVLSGDFESLKKYISAVKDYINQNNVSIIGIPNYTCPECKKDQSESTGDFKEIVPLNVLESFFDLCVLRVINVRESSIY